MSLKFILGNSGCGKTEYMYEKIVSYAEENPRKNYLCLVPEQYTMQTQRKLVDLSSNHAIMNIDVLSFQRLAYRVFDELGLNGISILEETGKNLVLRKVAQEQSDKLSVLKGNIHRMGYIGEVKSLISELMQYNITPEQLDDCISNPQLSKVLTAKLKDVQVMYGSFVEYLHSGKFHTKARENDADTSQKESYITAEELLHVLADKADKSAILKESVMVLDGFTGFTPVQMELLRKLMPICEEIWVSLTIDENEDFYHSNGMQELFDMPKKTMKTLMELAKATHTEILEPVVIHGGDTKRFKNAPSIYFMEQNLFRKSYKKKHGSIDEIEIYSIPNPKEELVWTARKINELVRTKNYRYRDIAVVTGDVSVYSNYVETIYRKYNIPYFLDMTKEVLFHPFIEFIRAILEVIKSDFSYDTVMRLLRSGYCKVTMDEADHLENYLLATGIRGKKMWSRRWLRMPKNEKAYDLESLENLRQKLMEGLLPVAKVFEEKTANVETQIKALYTYIVSLEVEKQLILREKELLEAGEQAKSKEYGLIYRIVMDLFEKCVRILGQEVLTIMELAEILDSGFEAAKVAVIPPGYDSVTIGDIERTRLGLVKVLIFIGVNEGIVPKSVNQGGIISQYERDTLESADITLAPGAREQAFIQKFYLYLNMTKPSEKLYLSYSRIDSEGKALRPSYLIRTILRMFPDMSVCEIEDTGHNLDTSTEESAMDYLITGKKNATWYALAKCFLESDNPKIRGDAKAVLDAFYHRYHHDPISRIVAESVYGKQIEGSVTRLEKYAKCAYAHFLSYGLHLQEREESGFESVDMGNLYHAALERYSKKLAESSYDWFTVPQKVRDAYAVSAMEEAILEFPNLSIYATAENEHMAKRMNHIFRQTVWALTMQVRKGRFVPNNFEISFSKADHLKALEFELENRNRIQLKGRIDRLDTCVDDNRLYVKVIDYKSGSTKFDLLSLYYGLQLQLVVYMNAAMELEKKKHPLKEIVPGGLFYYHIDDPVIEVGESFTEEDVKAQILRELKPNGLVNEEKAVYSSMDMELETDGGPLESAIKSNVIPVELKKDGSLSKKSSVASAEEFALISEYVNHHIEETGNEIYQGNVEVKPFVQGQSSGCDYCPYRAVCGFDVKIPGYEERKGTKADKEEILERMENVNALNRVKQNR